MAKQNKNTITSLEKNQKKFKKFLSDDLCDLISSSTYFLIR